MDWFKGTSIGNNVFSHEIKRFSYNFALKPIHWIPLIWGFPKIGVPPVIIHFKLGIPLTKTNQRAWGSPIRMNIFNWVSSCQAVEAITALLLNIANFAQAASRHRWMLTGRPMGRFAKLGFGADWSVDCRLWDGCTFSGMNLVTNWLTMRSMIFQNSVWLILDRDKRKQAVTENQEGIVVPHS